MGATAEPNFFIVGAPKAGTTALWTYLRQHPQIFMSTLKEPQFFASDIRGNQRNITNLPDYLELFRGAQQPAIGEASTCYLGSPAAPREIKTFCQQARIIIMLRNPIDVMYAQHSECVFDGTEHIADFRTALDSMETRVWRSGRCRGQPVQRLGYRELVKFSQQVRSFLEAFGRPNVHIIVYDDFAADSAEVYRSVLTFLGVSPSHECSFDVVHANRTIRSSAIQDLLRHPPNLVKRFTRAFLTKRARTGLGHRLNRINTRVVVRPMLDPEFRRRLETDFISEVQQLGHLVGRDLSSWVSSTASSRPV